MEKIEKRTLKDIADIKIDLDEHFLTRENIVVIKPFTPPQSP
jgi:hypothetical protein